VISNYIDWLSGRIAEYIFQRAGRTPVYKLKFAIKDTLYYLLFYIPIVVIGLLTGRFLESMITPILFSILRRYSGGFHLSSAVGCAILSAAMVLIAIYMPGQYWYNGFVITAIAAIMMLAFAPADSRAPTKYHRLFKWISVAMVASNFLLHLHLLAWIFLLQGITIIPYNKIFKRR
jgi:accessory gene regulator B